MVLPRRQRSSTSVVYAPCAVGEPGRRYGRSSTGCALVEDTTRPAIWEVIDGMRLGGGHDPADDGEVVDCRQ
jgi:hypothetical protein